MTNKIITISRQYGSGGRIIGEKLARELGIPFYDRELIILAAQESGIDKKIFENADEQATNSLLYSLAVGAFSPMGGNVTGVNTMPINDRLFLAQSDIIKKIATKGPCVIVGRCADYILRDCENAVNMFLYADLDKRVNAAVTLYGIPKDKAENVVLKMDKKRSTYHSHYAGGNWDDVSNYDICVDSGKLGVENTVNILKEYIKLSEKQQSRY